MTTAEAPRYRATCPGCFGTGLLPVPAGIRRPHVCGLCQGRKELERAEVLVHLVPSAVWVARGYPLGALGEDLLTIAVAHDDIALVQVVARAQALAAELVRRRPAA